MTSGPVKQTSLDESKELQKTFSQLRLGGRFRGNKERSMDAAISRGPGTPALPEETIGACLRRTAAEFGGREALVSREQGVRLTWAELDAEVDRLARGLIAAGLERGDRVGIWSPNRAEWTLTQFAAARAGAILLNVH